MMTKSHALEDKYNAEIDAKKIAQHEAEIIKLQDKVYQLNRMLSMRR